MSDAVLEQRGNVTVVDFGPDEELWYSTDDPGWDPPAARLPARWSPHPVRVLAARFARSQFAGDLCAAGRLLALSAVLLLGLWLVDHGRQLVLALIGGTA